MDLHTLLSLRHRQALITGAAGGLGRVLADTLAELEAALVLVDLHGTGLREMAADLRRRRGVDVTIVECDLEREDERERLVGAVPGSTLSILINNAALVGTSTLQGWTGPFERQDVGSWRRALEVNLTAAFHLCQLLWPRLKESPGANIVNIASIYGEHGPDWRLYEGTTLGNPAAYGASKGALLQLTRWLATTMAPHVRVNAISPGGIRRQQPEEFVRRYEARTPLRRMACEDDLRGALAVLASDAGAYITGQTLRVDGGWSAW